MVSTLRTCAKTGCRWPAAASLSFRYHTRQVWLLDLSPQPNPSLYDLCPHHADAQTVPKGWEFVDDRVVRPAPVEPSAAARADQAEFDRAAAAASPSPSHRVAGGSQRGGGRPAGQPRTAQPRQNRYATLVADLPRLAAEAAATLPPRPGAGRRADADPHGPARASELERDLADVTGLSVETAPAVTAATSVPAQPPSTPPPAPVPSRDLAPLPRTETSWRPPAEPPPPAGQLSIPVDDLQEGPGGVVVSFPPAGSRRRGDRVKP